MPDLEIYSGLAGMRVTGLKETLRSLEKTGVDAQDLKQAMREIAAIIVQAAKGRVPKRSGKLAMSIRPGAAKTKSIVYAGNGRKNGAPYAGVIHYGWPAHSISARPFLDQARALKIEEATAKLIEEIGRLADENHLDNTIRS